MELLGKYIKGKIKYILLIVISLITGLFTYLYIQSSLIDMVERSLIEIAKQGAKTVESDISRQLDNLVTVSQLDIISNDYYYRKNKLDFLSSLDHDNQNLEYALVSLDGTLYSVFGKEYDVSDEEFFKKAITGGRAAAMTRRRFSRGYCPMAFAVPVYNQGGEITGALCALYSMEDFCQLVSKSSFGASGYGFIIDGEGNTLAHIDRDLVKKRVNFIVEARNDSDLSGLAKIEKRMISEKTGSGSYIYKGELKHLGFAGIANMSWSYAATAPRSEVFSSVNSLLGFIAVFIFIASLGMISITIYIAAVNRKIRHEEQSLRRAVETANIIIISFLEDGIILDFNHKAVEKLGYSRDQVIKTLRIYDLLGTKDQLRLGRVLDENKKGSVGSNFDLNIRTKTGESVYVVFNLNTVDQKTGPKVYELMGLDISERVKSEMELFEKHEELSAVYEELAASEEELKEQLDELINQKIMLQEKDERHNLVVEASNIGIWDWDISTESHFYSEKWYEIFGLSRDKARGHEKQWVIDRLILPEDRDIFLSAYNEHINQKTSNYECEYRIKTENGRIKWINSVGKALWDSDGKLFKMAGADTDITEKREAEEKVNKLAYYDTLTNLPNRSRLIEYFNNFIRRPGEKLAFIYIDLENFKIINDSYGHRIGDRLLIEVSDRLKRFCNGKMLLSRLGGDEYAITIRDYGSEEKVADIVNDLILNMESLIRVDGNNISISTNIGIALYPKDGNSFDELLKNADTALFRATEKKCKYLFYSREMNDEIMERLNLRNSLKAGLENNEFLLYYQPQYRSTDKKIMGFEALARWNSKTLGMVPPSKFIPIAEETRLIIPLGGWLLEEAVKFLRKMYGMGHSDLLMSVNISVIQLIQKDFPDTVIRLLLRYDIPPKSIELEITESGMMESVDLVIDNINNLRSKGIRFALDDFGTGYSSLNYLTKLPITTLKIDKSFIDNIGQVREKSLLIGPIVDIGQKLGLSIVAEGVETEDQYNYLVKKRCERIQGYLFSKPLPGKEVLRLMD